MTKILYYIKNYHEPTTLYTEDGNHWYSLHDFVRNCEYELESYIVYQVIDGGEGENVYCLSTKSPQYNIGGVEQYDNSIM